MASPEKSINIEDVGKQESPEKSYDSKINCTSNQSLRSILDVTLSNVEEFADSFNLKEKRTEFMSLFTDVIKNFKYFYSTKIKSVDS